jgi:predicted O-linked N-acetylglucosamine transferase (SPINDLY family)
MGVPLLTLPGKSFASRVGASLLTALGLPELIAGDAAAYVEIARRLATDREALAALRTRLADAISTLPLFDPETFARQLETAFETVHPRRMAGQPPASFEVDPA